MKKRILTIVVEDHFYKYITESIGGDTVRPERDSTLLAIIKPYLETKSSLEAETEEIPEGYSPIHIELPELRQTYNSQTGKVIYCDTLFRDCISPKGVEKVRRYFKNCFKMAFRTFMDGYTENQNDNNAEADETSRMRVKRGVVAFLLQYHIDINERLVSTLTRDWYRHRDRTEQNRFTPVFY